MRIRRVGSDGGKKKTEICKEGLDNLRYAVVELAIKDYKALLLGKKSPTTDCNVTELESFFRSGWYRTLCDYDGERLISQIREQVQAEKRKELSVL